MIEFRSGYKHTADDGSSGVAWWLVRAADVAHMTDEEVLGALDVGCRYYGGPGRPFANDPWLRRRGSRVLVTQTGGVDI